MKLLHLLKRKLFTLLYNFVRKGLVLFWSSHRGLLKRNIQFKDKYLGDTCIILGNGGSLKYYDISKLPKDIPIITCACALIDKRLEGLKVEFCVLTDSYLLYKILFNTYAHIRNFQINKIRTIYERMISRNPQVNFLVSITNFYSKLARSRNVSFSYHFGEKGTFKHDLAGVFSNSAGAADVMMATAKYLGFKKAIIIGCDYFGVPPMLGHFYANYKPFEYNEANLAEYRERVLKASAGLDVLVILPKGIKSPDFNYNSYEEFFGIERVYQENYEFINSEDIESLNEAAESYQAVMNLDQ
ncbi:hypothetical protein ND861_11110 [Leptospira sp. 2 VSF19]|uniref:DUF115 domain-containing protein n=1 Tax=Leptospira soteropolitanensis TaxID=2950025 RepID=A0AAW5VK88_9LEPT|nr:hypothetical protein [Leptospira soteropolitanensis]MCW7493148.1 hypothetical protein [Leptospira soteropolitanensis]MCW7500783.1 hypothetical protein [Leptospira soteropolitanensis]MCW7522998.1 hypothetical protein [Leptospira soteropolitanensis]MCW7526895.1 hypothetical protein [Leptospira soteropolitanensis]MCW7530716.1 hypothetical protein [Leptospira soteropolitanensis]